MSAGSVKKRGDSWRGRFRNADGRDVQRTFTKKVDADRWVRDQISALERGVYVDPNAGRITFAAFADQWREAQHVRESTAKLHAQRITNYLVPVLGNVPLRSIRRSHVVEVVRRCSADLNLSPLVTRYTISTLRAILDSAVREQLIPRNVAADRTIQMPKRERVSVTLTPEQVSAIADEITPRLRAAVVLAASTGLRPGELFALTADRISPAIHVRGDVVPRQATIRVDRQITAARQFGPVKTTSSNRDVTIPESVVRVLIDHVATSGLGDDGVLFSTATGKLMHSSHQSKAWSAAVEGLDLPDGSWHLLRHHHASSLLSQGLNPAMVARRLGHANAAITMNTYAHCLPNDDERALEISERIAERLA